SKRVFRDQYHVRLARDSRPQRQMSRMSPHHFDDLYPTMRSCRRARSFKHFRDVTERRIESECVIRSREILIDRLGNTDYAHALLRETCSNTECVFTAARNESVKF